MKRKINQIAVLLVLISIIGASCGSSRQTDGGCNCPSARKMGKFKS